MLSDSNTVVLYYTGTQLTESTPVEVLSHLLVELVSTTHPDHDLYGGDLRALTTVMADVVDRSAARLLPALKNTTARSLSANISSVSSTSTRF